jgi:hypothetical protein
MEFAKATPERDFFGFSGQASLYSRIRPTYPDSLYEEIFPNIPSGKQRVCLDIGTGTG